MADLPSLMAKIDLDDNPMDKSIERVNKKIEKLNQKMQRTFKKMENLGRKAAVGLGVVSTGFIGIMKGTSDLEASMKKLEVVTSGNTKAFKELQKVSKELEKGKLFNKSEINSAISSAYAMGKNYQLNAKQIGDIVKVAKELGVIYGKDLSDSTERLMAAMRGEAESAEALGLSLSATAVKAWMMEAGIAGNIETMTLAEQAQIRYQMLIDRTKDSMGASAQMSSTLQGAWQRLKSIMVDFFSGTGKGFLQPVVDTMNKISAFLDYASESPALQTFIRNLIKLGFAFTAIGVTIGILGKIGTLTTGLLTAGFSLLTSPIGLVAIMLGLVLAKFDDIVKGFETGWNGAYNSFKDIWADPTMTLFEKVGATVGKFSIDTWTALKAGWLGSYASFSDLWADPTLNTYQKILASILMVANQTWTGLKAGWLGQYGNFKELWGDPSLSLVSKVFGSISLFAKKAWDGLKLGWASEYKSMSDLWADPTLGTVEKVFATVPLFGRLAWSGLKAGWTGNYISFKSIWADPTLSTTEKIFASISGVAKITWFGLSAGWSGAYKNFSDVWNDKNLGFWGKSMASLSLGIKNLWNGYDASTPGLKTVFKDAYDQLVAVWQNPDLSFWARIWQTLLMGPKVLMKGIQSIGANLTALLGGDSQKYLDDTNTALEGIKKKIEAIQATESVSQKIQLTADIGKDVYRLPAKFVLSGFVNDFNESWTDNAVNMLSAIGVTKFLGGSWRLAAGFALGADFLFGDEWTGNSWMDKLIKAAEGAGIAMTLGAGILPSLAIGLIASSINIDEKKIIPQWEKIKADWESGNYGEATLGVLKIFGDIIWGGVKAAGQTIKDVSNWVKERLISSIYGYPYSSSANNPDLLAKGGVIKPVDIGLLDLAVMAGGKILNYIWSGLEWAGNTLVNATHGLADRVREQLGIEKNELPVDLGEDLKVILLGAVTGTSIGIEWLTDKLSNFNDIISAIREKIRAVSNDSKASGTFSVFDQITSTPEEKLSNSILKLGENMASLIGQGFKTSFNILGLISDAIDSAVTDLTGSDLAGGIASKIPIMFTAAWAAGSISRMATKFMNAFGLKPKWNMGAGLAFAGNMMYAVQIATEWAEGKKTLKDILADQGFAFAAGTIAGLVTGSGTIGVGVYTIVLNTQMGSNLLEPVEDQATKANALIAAKFGDNKAANAIFRPLELGISGTGLDWSEEDIKAEVEKLGIMGKFRYYSEEIGYKVWNWIWKGWQGAKEGWNSFTDFVKTLGEALATEYEDVKQIGITIGEKLWEGIKFVFGFGWVKKLLNLDGEKVYSNEDKFKLENPLDLSSIQAPYYSQQELLTNIKLSAKEATDEINELDKAIQGVQPLKINVDEYMYNYTPERASGGYISGPGTGTSDSILARLSNGEFVINAASTKKYLPLLQEINQNKFATGGLVSGVKNAIARVQTGIPKFSQATTQPINTDDFFADLNIESMLEPLEKVFNVIDSTMGNILEVITKTATAIISGIESLLNELGADTSVISAIRESMENLQVLIEETRTSGKDMFDEIRETMNKSDPENNQQEGSNESEGNETKNDVVAPGKFELLGAKLDISWVANISRAWKNAISSVSTSLSNLDFTGFGVALDQMVAKFSIFGAAIVLAITGLDKIFKLSQNFKSGFQDATSRSLEKAARPFKRLGAIIGRSLVPVIEAFEPVIRGLAYVFGVFYNVIATIINMVSWIVGIQLKTVDLDSLLGDGGDDGDDGMTNSAGWHQPVNNTWNVSFTGNTILDTDDDSMKTLYEKFKRYAAEHGEELVV